MGRRRLIEDGIFTFNIKKAPRLIRFSKFLEVHVDLGSGVDEKRDKSLLCNRFLDIDEL